MRADECPAVRTVAAGPGPVPAVRVSGDVVVVGQAMIRPPARGQDPIERHVREFLAARRGAWTERDVAWLAARIRTQPGRFPGVTGAEGRTRPARGVP